MGFTILCQRTLYSATRSGCNVVTPWRVLRYISHSEVGEMSRAVAHTRRAAKAQDLTLLESGLLSYKGLQAVQEIATRVQRAIKLQMGGKGWRSRMQDLPEKAMIAAFREGEAPVPRLSIFVVNTLDDWLLASPPKTPPPAQKIFSLTEVARYCLKLELECAIYHIQEGATYYSKIWKVSPGCLFCKSSRRFLALFPPPAS